MKKLQALLDQDLNVEDEETFQPSPVADRQIEQEVLPLVAWHFSAEDCNYLDPQHAAKDFDSVEEWIAYNEEASLVLEAAYAENKSEISYTEPDSDETYVVTLKQDNTDDLDDIEFELNNFMTQTNIMTGTIRWVKREEKATLDKEAQEAALADSVSTLSAILGVKSVQGIAGS